MSFDALIIGNGVAGYACATRLARHGRHPLLVGPGLPHDRPPLTRSALAAASSQPLATPEALTAQGVTLLDGIADEVDLRNRRAVVRRGAETIDVEAGAVVLAVGLEYAPPPIPGLEDAHVNATPAGLDRLVRALQGGPRSVVVVGAGLIGVETAATMARLGHQVTVVDTEARPLHRLHDPLPALAESALRALGVTFRGEVRILQAVLPADGGRARLELELGDALEADVIVAATGGRQSQLELSPALTFPISVDTRMQVPDLEGVYVIGDCASPRHMRFGEMRFPHWDAAHGMAERAADAIAGVDGVYQRLPYWWSDIGDLRVAEVGYAAAVAEWEEADGLHVGRDEQGEVAAVLVVGSMSRLREARKLVEQRENVPEPQASTSAISFDRDIRHLFREDDRRAMDYAFDLWLYEDVRDWAPRILERMEDGTMPCDQEWSPEHLERFRSWIEAGCAP